MLDWEIRQGDCLALMADMEPGSVDCCVTSPPYFGLRSYLPDGVVIRKDLTPEELEHLLAELSRLGINPTTDDV